MLQRNARAVVWALWVVLMTPALFMSQVFWGTYATFALFPSSDGMATIGLMGLMGVLIAAIPFGLLFGLVTPGPAIRNAALVALTPALLIFAFGAWVASPYERLWWPAIAEALWFLLLFSLFAVISARMRSSSLLPWRPIWPTLAFALLSAIYYFGPIVYLRFAHANAAVAHP